MPANERAHALVTTIAAAYLDVGADATWRVDTDSLFGRPVVFGRRSVTMRLRVRGLRVAGACTALLLIIVACGGAASPGGTPGAGDLPSPGTTQVQPSAGSQPSAGEGTGAGDSGATIRLVNVWAEPGKLGPNVRLRVYGDTESPSLVEAAPGEVTDFVAIPRASFGEGGETLEVISADAPADENGIILDGANPGDRITVIAHAAGSVENVGLATKTTWDAGGPTGGLPWPSTPPDKATLMVYPGALMLLPDEVSGVALATTDGACLIDAESGQEETGGWGGNIEKYFALDAGSTEIGVAGFPRGHCEQEPTMGTVTVEASAGQRIALIPWGTGADEIALLLVDMGTP
jgi:hypothetical protein